MPSNFEKLFNGAQRACRACRFVSPSLHYRHPKRACPCQEKIKYFYGYQCGRNAKNGFQNLGRLGAGNVFIGCNPSSLALRGMSQRSLILRHNFLTVLRTTRIKPHHCGQDRHLLIVACLCNHFFCILRGTCSIVQNDGDKHQFISSLCAKILLLYYRRALKPLPQRAAERGSSML